MVPSEKLSLDRHDVAHQLVEQSRRQLSADELKARPNLALHHIGGWDAGKIAIRRHIAPRLLSTLAHRTFAWAPMVGLYPIGNGSVRRNSCSNLHLPRPPTPSSMLREFVDKEGEFWRVWDVSPVLHAENWPRTTKRFAKVPAGWLCFESRSQRRRLSPIPTDWGDLDDAALEALRDRAEIVPITPREVGEDRSPA